MQEAIKFFKSKMGQYVVAALILGGFWAINYFGLASSNQIHYGAIKVPAKNKAYIPIQVDNTGGKYKIMVTSKQPRRFLFGVDDPSGKLVKQGSKPRKQKGTLLVWTEQPGKYNFWITANCDSCPDNFEYATIEIRKLQ